MSSLALIIFAALRFLIGLGSLIARADPLVSIKRRARIPRPRRHIALGSELGGGVIKLEGRILLNGTFHVTVPGPDDPSEPVFGTLRWAKRQVDAQPPGEFNIELDSNSVLVEPIYENNQVTIYGQGYSISDPGQPIAVVGTAPVTFRNVNFITSGGSAAVTATGQLWLESCITDGPVQSNVSVPCTVTIDSTTFQNIPANAGPAVSLQEGAGVQVVFSNNQMSGNDDQLFAYAGSSSALLTFSGNAITGNTVNTTAAGMTFDGPANLINNDISNGTYAGPIWGVVLNPGVQFSINTLSVNGNHSGTTEAPVGGSLIVQNNGGTFSVKNATTSLNTVAGGALWLEQGLSSSTSGFINMTIIDNTCGGLYSAIPIALQNAVFCNNVNYGINASLINNSLASSGWIDVGVLLGTAAGSLPDVTNFNPLPVGFVIGLTVEYSSTSPLITFGAAPGSNPPYLGDRTSFN